jgi:8-oxo-dGTP diphosphatase/(d)CTP diphosphatase
MGEIMSVVRVIIQNKDGQILFLKRKNAKNANNMWCLPGGRINTHENAEKAIIREVKEETNLDLKNIKFLFDFDIPPINGQTEKHSICSVFVADSLGLIKLNSEHSEFAWILNRELSNYEIAFNHDKIIEKFLEL